MSLHVRFLSVSKKQRPFKIAISLRRQKSVRSLPSRLAVPSFDDLNNVILQLRNWLCIQLSNTSLVSMSIELNIFWSTSAISGKLDVQLLALKSPEIITSLCCDVKLSTSE